MSTELDIAVGGNQWLSSPVPLELPTITRAPDMVDRLARHVEGADLAVRLAERYCKTAMVRPDYRGKPLDGAVAILYGDEIGLQPLQALQRVIIIHGVPTIEARTMVALLKAKGYRFTTVETSDEKVTVTGKSPRGEEETATWTIERAARAGYTSNKKYQTDPQGMLYAKASAEVCRKLAPDVLLGIDSTEDVQLDPPPVHVTSERVSAAEVLGEAPSNPGAKPEDPQVDRDDAPSEPRATTAQQRRLSTLLDAAGATEKDQKLAYLSRQFERDITSSKDLTKAEATALIEFLESTEPAEPAQGELAGAEGAEGEQ